MLAGLLLGVLPLLPLPPQEAPPAGGPGSLEAVLERIRERRLEVQARLQASVRDVVDGLERLGREPPGSRDPSFQIERLQALGVEAAPLLLSFLDPGPEAEAAALYRARMVARGLAGMPTDATVEELFRLAEEGSPTGQALALRVLGHARDAERVSSRLLLLLDALEDAGARAEEAAAPGADDEGLSGEPEAKDAIGIGKTPERGDSIEVELFGALARLPGRHNETTLATRLLEASPSIARRILTVWTERRAVEGKAAVLELARDPQRVAPLLDPVVAYWRAVPGTAGPEVAAALVDLALAPPLSAPAKRAAVEALIDLQLELDSDLRKRLEPASDSYDAPLRESALVCLALAGDRNARRKLTKSLDDEVDRNDDYPPAWERRGDLLLRLRDYAGAAKDYREAIDLLERERRGVGAAIHVKLARCYALDGRLRNAYETLSSAHLRDDELATLAADPDFAALREHSRYGRLFE